MEVSQIVALYKKMLQNDGELKRLKSQISSGDLAALQQYGIRAGQLSVDALQKGTADGIADQNSIIQILDGVFRENYQAVANAALTALKAANQAAGLGLNGSESDYVNTAVQFADKLSGYDDISEGLNSLTNDIVLQSQRYADDSERRSAEFASDSGLEVLVTREYDNVGVHTTDKGGGEVCQWCMDRCGTDVPYEEAYSMGMFERHPGCGCIITYKTKHRTYKQGKGDWETNNWNTLQEQDERVDRIRNNNRDPERNLKRWNVEDVKKEYLRDADAGIGSIHADTGYQYDTHQNEQDVSTWMLRNFGGNINLLKESTSDGVHTPDYLWDGKLWDLKSPEGNGKRTIDNQFKTIDKQIAPAPGGMIMDCSKLKFSNDEIISKVSKRIRLNNFAGDVIIKRKETIIAVLRKK